MNAFVNPFIPEKESYKRDINPIPHYIDQAAHYLSTMTGQSYEFCKHKVIAGIKSGKIKSKIPKIEYLQRMNNGDREPAETTLLHYIKDVAAQGEILAPTMTTYVPAEKEVSLLAMFIEKNVKKRSTAKKAMFAAQAEEEKYIVMTRDWLASNPDHTEAAETIGGFKRNQIAAATKAFFEEIKQRNFKLSNNACSGAHASPSNILYNQTAHSTLTSNCRLTSGYGNANNEKLLAGNRHYRNVDIVLNNIVSITRHTDYELLTKVMERHKLHYPTVEETIEVVRYSLDLYSPNSLTEHKYINLINKLTKEQRAAFVYTGDIYHVMKFNDVFMRGFIDNMSTKLEVKDKSDYIFNKPAIEMVHGFPEDVLNHAHLICAKEMKAKGKDYKAMAGSLELDTLVMTAAQITGTLTTYSDFIKFTMVSDNVPASVSYFPDSIRRAALTSDTDSTIFTVQDWVIWNNKGTIAFDEKAVSVASAMIFISSQAIVHVLARMSKNAGVETKRLHQIGMKNEFFFPVFIPTSVSKHYSASMSCQEGNVFDKIKYEIKGVHMKNSNIPKPVMAGQTKMIKDVLDIVQSGKKISALAMLKRVADAEREIIAGLTKGDPTYFKIAEIKTPDSYNADSVEKTPYLHYLFWKSCLADKYGEYGEPPYAVIKVSTTLTNPSATATWLNNLQDKQIADRIKQFLAKYNRDKITTLQLPMDAVLIHGMPAEFLSIINTRKIVADLCKTYYMVLETLGIPLLNDNRTVLASDYY